MSPQGSIYRSDQSIADTFLFDCRTVPRPTPNLVYIFRGVCNRSGFQPSALDPAGFRPGCPILACQYNCREDGRLAEIQADYRLAVAGDLQAEDTSPDGGGVELRVIWCPKGDIYAFDPEPGGARRCPLCGQSLPETSSTTEATQLHYSGTLPFGPPLTTDQALGLREPDLNLGQPVCDPAVFHPDADLRGRDLREERLYFAQLRGADLRGANLELVPLLHASLDHARLGGANLVDANLDGADLSHADLTRANLRDASLRGANLSHAILVEADLSGADLSEAQLANVTAAGATLRNASMAEAFAETSDFSEAVLEDVDLREATFSRATFHRAQLIRVSGPEAIFEFADFRESRMDGCTFTSAALRGANFRGAVVRDTDLSMAILVWARTRDWRAERVNLDGARTSEEPEVHAGPGVSPPTVIEQELSRPPLSAREREELVRRVTQ